MKEGPKGPVNKWVLLAGILLGMGLIVLGINAWPSSDEEAIAAKLSKLEEAIAVEGEENPVMRLGRLRREFEEIFEDDVRVHIPEINQQTRGRRQLADLGARGPVLYSKLTVAFTGQETIVDSANKSAKTTTMAKLAGSRGGDYRSDERRVRIEWSRASGEWLISDVKVEAGEGRRGLF